MYSLKKKFALKRNPSQRLARMGRGVAYLKASKKVKSVSSDTFDRWDMIREYLGDDELLEVIPKMLGTDTTERLIGWICQDYDINLDGDDEEDDYGASKKKARKMKVMAKSPHRRVSPKQLKDMVAEGLAVDITNHPDVIKVSKDKGLELVGTGFGINGMNCAMFKGKDGKIYVITARNSNLLTLA